MNINDFPLHSSPAAQISLSQAGALVFGATYSFPGTKTTMTGLKNITDAGDSLFYIRSLSLSADIPEQDYQDALRLAGGTPDVPGFQMWIQGGSSASVFNDRILLQNYVNDQEFRQVIHIRQTPVTLTGEFKGTLQQTAALAGVLAVTLTVQLWGHLITDPDFISRFMKSR